MDSPSQWITDPDLVTGAIKLLVWAVGIVGTALVSVLLYIWTKTDTKIDRIATSLETLTVSTAVDIATIKATCKANHHGE